MTIKQIIGVFIIAIVVCGILWIQVKVYGAEATIIAYASSAIAVGLIAIGIKLIYD